MLARTNLWAGDSHRRRLRVATHRRHSRTRLAISRFQREYPADLQRHEAKAPGQGFAEFNLEPSRLFFTVFMFQNGVTVVQGGLVTYGDIETVRCRSDLSYVLLSSTTFWQFQLTGYGSLEKFSVHLAFKPVATLTKAARIRCRTRRLSSEDRRASSRHWQNRMLKVILERAALVPSTFPSSMPILSTAKLRHQMWSSTSAGKSTPSAPSTMSLRWGYGPGPCQFAFFNQIWRILSVLGPRTASHSRVCRQRYLFRVLSSVRHWQPAIGYCHCGEILKTCQ